MQAFDVLGEPVRRRILEVLHEGEASSGEIVEAVQSEFAITQAAVSQHLKVLREAGFARVRPEGTRRIYRLEAGPFSEVDQWLARFRGCWSPHPIHADVTQICDESAKPKGRTAQPWEGLGKADHAARLNILQQLTGQANEAAQWADAAWDGVAEVCRDRDGDACAAAARLLCKIARHVDEGKVARDLDCIFAIMMDERQSVARPVLQEVWRIGLVSKPIRDSVVQKLSSWFRSRGTGKNNLQIRFDIIDGFAKLQRASGDPDVSAAMRQIVGD